MSKKSSSRHRPKSKAAPRGSISILGITWYREHEYDRMKAMFPDGDKLPDTYDDWRKKAQEMVEFMGSRGYVMVKAYLDPEAFPEWCRSKGFEMDGKARAQFGQEYASNAQKHLR
jgi:hypothetical protein